MEITNARIKHVTLGFGEWDELAAKMMLEFQGHCCEWSFVMTNPLDVRRLVKLMRYTRSYNVQDLKDKVIRIVMLDKLFRGFGDPIEDKFVPVFGEKMKVVTETQFEELLKTE